MVIADCTHDPAWVRTIVIAVLVAFLPVFCFTQPAEAVFDPITATVAPSALFRNDTIGGTYSMQNI
jgi:Cu/Ag efflux pump CusA